MPVMSMAAISAVPCIFFAGQLTILDEDVETLLDGERGVENDQTEAQRQHVVTGSHLEKVANGALSDAISVILVILRLSHSCAPRQGCREVRWCHHHTPTTTPRWSSGLTKNKSERKIRRDDSRRKSDLPDPSALPDQLRARCEAAPLDATSLGAADKTRAARS